MKKNKTIAYMLAATLLVGGTFLGTKALYSDQETVDTGFVIKTGTLDVSIVDDNGWYVTQNGTEAIAVNDDFANAKPGDVFNRYFEVENTGTLDQTLTFTGGEVIKEDENLEITVPNLKETTLKPGDSKQVLLMVKIKEDVKDQQISFDLSDNISPIVINAVQTPAKK
ncbi:MAG: TasA family protein [Peptostreptococcaceae bacterium]